MRVAVVLAVLALAACSGGGGGPPSLSVAFGGAPLVSGQSPANPSAQGSQPQPVNSLPPGAQGLQSSGPNNTVPNALSATVSGAR